jgi:hypothetical protein
MMMAWKYYSTIIQIRVTNAGGEGEELVGRGVTLAGRNGCNQTITANKYNHGEFGGDTTKSLIALLSLPAFFSIFALFKL